MTSRPQDPTGPAAGRPDACRRALGSLENPEAHEHAKGCPECAARLALRARLQTALRLRPATPSALHADALLERIHERIVEASESASVVGEEIANRSSLTASVEQWPAPLLESSISRAVRNAPQSPTHAEWTRVRAHVVAAMPRRQAAGRLLLWAAFAAAAAAVIGTTQLSSSPSTEQIEHRIVFADLPSAPAIDFVAVRRGALH